MSLDLAVAVQADVSGTGNARSPSSLGTFCSWTATSGTLRSGRCGALTPQAPCHMIELSGAGSCFVPQVNIAGVLLGVGEGEQAGLEEIQEGEPDEPV